MRADARQLDMFAASAPTPAPTDQVPQDPAAALIAWRDRFEHVPVDPKRLDRGGDIGDAYCADTICMSGKTRDTFHFRNCEWVTTGITYRGGEIDCECYRVVSPSAFEGATAPYADHDWHAARTNEMGGYHGMAVKSRGRDVVLIGPPVLFVKGASETLL
jgi:hypothetical protein